jgi:hypothetical protein
MSHDWLAHNAIFLLEDILDEQLEHDPEPSHQLAKGLFDLARDGYENRLICVANALAIMNKCHGVLHPNAKPYTIEALADL